MMEWHFTGRDTRDIGLLRDEVVAYLRRHGEPDADYDGPRLVVSELLSNVWRHTGRAGWLHAFWRDDHATLIVRDVGPGFDWIPSEAAATVVGGRGMIVVDALSSDMAISRRDVGTQVTVTLPITRAAAVSIDPPVRRLGSLPALEEATPAVGFGREAFLRALVVQLASTTDLQLGPDVSERLVAQVGIDVGSQMEAEYRASTANDGPLDAAQLGECFVRLKAAIGGDFHVTDIDDDHVSLVNHVCPFGTDVQRAPGLCRMTSSVFGGIAARATNRETVVSLDERIAVGDPQCRVTVTFGDAVRSATWGHHYQPPL